MGLLKKSNLTKTQFETILVDQLGSEIANKALTREEMTRLRQTRAKISRGAFNRTLKQARTNVSGQSIPFSSLAMVVSLNLLASRLSWRRRRGLESKCLNSEP